ncbi:Gfo/Idh/MocA family oxidoreductase [Rhizobiales bacterium]|uniref:Gfo/Idh/MocA family protein n=1 Tax=Hongsoonwoonella zoysiae TaxID=2821844 RepID=UPI0015604C59|nr:Gfo/Idh/MocA family oxidoreductase [Hongsoonwoonella zoysiae]NRG18994.1 Gfo/Idh/MocA family oxidoreductase [Hongsoonwoonella zoysiae]
MNDDGEHSGKSLKKLRVVMVGAGFFSTFHVDGWLRNDGAEIVGLADSEVEKARAVLVANGADLNSIAVQSDALKILRGLKPDIVDIAAPPSAHLGLIREATKSTVTAIICQKPFCTSLKEAREAIRLAADAGIKLIVHENFRFQPWYRAIRWEIETGRIGEVYQATFRLRPGDGQGKDAYLSRQPYFQKMERFLIHETAVHWIDTFRFLLGEPEAVFADLRRLNPAIAGEDSGIFIYRYGDGRRAVFDGNRLVDHVAENPRLTMGECLVEGSKGVLALDGNGNLSFRALGDQHWIVLFSPRSREGFGGDCVFELQKHVTDHLLKGTALENEASAYLRNMEIEEAVYRAAMKGRFISLRDSQTGENDD